jgi:DNA primase
MKMLAERYGLNPDRSGFISCPFHQDNTPSLKLYDPPGDGFYCFGCGAGGTVIDFVMKLFHISFSQALVRLNTDFRLGLAGQKADYRTRLIWQREQTLKRLERTREIKRRQELAEEHCRLWQTVKIYKPWSDEWCDAYHRLSIINCLLEDL